MDLASLIADDMTDVMDGLQSVTVSLIRSAGTTTVTVSGALRQPVDRGLTNYRGVQIQGDETVWNVSDHQLNPSANGRVIQFGDTIAVGGVTWKVISVTNTTLATRWECVCRKVL